MIKLSFQKLKWAVFEYLPEFLHKIRVVLWLTYVTFELLTDLTYLKSCYYLKYQLKKPEMSNMENPDFIDIFEKLNKK